ncbi:MAG: ATP-dependent Clp protease adaptor ClpS [Planctomycetaceae bacterium]|nr:ATP-dependent Clp protease adaptor ClpS [Planctomycetaceae bacterium]
MPQENQPVHSRSPRQHTWTRPPRLRKMPPWKVLLHNDDINDTNYVVATLARLTPLSISAATQRMLEAHQNGIAMVLTTHQERAELYRDQFTSMGLTVTIEVDD